MFLWAIFWDPLIGHGARYKKNRECPIVATGWNKNGEEISEQGMKVPTNKIRDKLASLNKKN